MSIPNDTEAIKFVDENGASALATSLLTIVNDNYPRITPSELDEVNDSLDTLIDQLNSN